MENHRGSLRRERSGVVRAALQAARVEWTTDRGMLGHHPAQRTFVCLKVTGYHKHRGAYKHVKKTQGFTLSSKNTGPSNTFSGILALSSNQITCRIVKRIQSCHRWVQFLRWLLPLEQKPSFSVEWWVPTNLASRPITQGSHQAMLAVLHQLMSPPHHLSLLCQGLFVLNSLHVQPRAPHSAAQLALHCICSAAPRLWRQEAYVSS